MDQDKDENSIHINIEPISTINTISDTISDTKETINDTKEIISDAKETIASTISSSVTELNTFKNNFTSGLLPRFMLNKTLPSIQNFSNTIKNGIQNDIQLTSNTIKNGIQTITDDIQNNIQEGIQPITNGLQNSKPTTRSNSSLNSKASSRRESINEVKELQLKPDESSTVITSSRSRKLDRRNLSNDILAELPISIRFNDSINIDNNETLENYIDDWKKWDDEDCNKLDILIEEIWTEEEKYKHSASFNHNCARGIQFTLILMGMSGIFLQSKGASPETVNNYTIASSALTTLTSSLLTFFSFAKKAPHFAKISFMLRRLRNWVEKLLIIPVDKRCSPYDIYTIAKITFEAILNEAKEGLSEHK